MYLIRIEVERSWIVSVSKRGDGSGGWCRGLGVSFIETRSDVVLTRLFALFNLFMTLRLDLVKHD